MVHVLVRQTRFPPSTHFGLHLLGFTSQIMWLKGQQGEQLFLVYFLCAKYCYISAC